MYHRQLINPLYLIYAKPNLMELTHYVIIMFDKPNPMKYNYYVC